MSENPEKCVEIYRNEANNYSFVCFHCGDITDTAERILAHVENHFNLADSSASPNPEDFIDTINDEPFSLHEPYTCTTKTVTALAQIPEELAADTNEFSDCDYDAGTLQVSPSAFNEDIVDAPTNGCPDNIQDTVKCKHCRRRYINEHTLEAHIKRVHTPKPTTKQLLENAAIFRKPSKRKPKTGSVQQNQCEECDFVVITITGLINHMVEVHSRCDVTEASPLKCEFCPKLFVRKYRLNRHMWTDHPHRDQPFECTECGAMFRNKGNLAAHSLKHASVADECFTCNTCSKSFKTQSSLSRHLWNLCNRDPNRKTYKCDLCAIQFNYKVSHVNHMRKHSGEQPYQCYLCGLAFRLAGKLTEHMKTKHPTNMFACPQCPKEFRTNYMLNSHIVTHSSERTFACDQCSKLFKSRRTLRQHNLTHGEVKQYKCNYCGLEFAQKAGLRGHERTKHLLASSMGDKGKRKIV